METEIEKQIEAVKKELAKTHWTPARLRLWKKLGNLQIKLESQKKQA